MFSALSGNIKGGRSLLETYTAILSFEVRTSIYTCTCKLVNCKMMLLLVWQAIEMNGFNSAALLMYGVKTALHCAVTMARKTVKPACSTLLSRGVTIHVFVPNHHSRRLMVRFACSHDNSISPNMQSQLNKKATAAQQLRSLSQRTKTKTHKRGTEAFRSGSAMLSWSCQLANRTTQH